MGRIDLDYTLIKIGCESLAIHFQRTRKLITKELSQIVALLQQPAMPVGDLQQLKERLLVLRKALSEAYESERIILTQEQQKLEALVGGVLTDSRAAVVSSDCQRRHLFQVDGENAQLERLIGDYMLRQGYFGTLALLPEETCTLRSPCELETFLSCQIIEQQILNQRCDTALAWCTDHASKLRRLNSVLEFKLHKHQFLELVRRGDRVTALNFATEHLAAAASMPEHSAEVQQAMATLAFENVEDCVVPEYRQLFDETRWINLAILFREESRRVYGVAKRAPLEICLHAGLTALKTPVCLDSAGQHPQCPICSVTGRALADGLPFAHFANSYLTCRYTGFTMDSGNSPVALPNGQVYSAAAIEQLQQAATSLQHTSGLQDEPLLICPRTGDTFMAGHVQSIYII